MLAKRIIPTILVRGQTAYKGPGFGSQCTRSVGSALAIASTHARRGVDELLILDIGATPEGRGPDLDLVRALSDDCYIPITVGGGVRTLDDIDALLRAGADKVAIGAAAREPFDNYLLERAADRFGAQAIVQVAEPVRNEHARTPAPWIRTDVTLSKHAGEIVLIDPVNESTMRGYGLGWLQIVQRSARVPVILCGGCAGPEDMLRAIRAGADGVAAGALFQFTDTTPRDCARYLKANGVEVRL